MVQAPTIFEETFRAQFQIHLQNDGGISRQPAGLVGNSGQAARTGEDQSRVWLLELGGPAQSFMHACAVPVLSLLQPGWFQGGELYKFYRYRGAEWVGMSKWPEPAALLSRRCAAVCRRWKLRYVRFVHEICARASADFSVDSPVQ